MPVLFTKSPKVTDKILFRFETTDINECAITNPYKVDNISIFYLEKDFSRSNNLYFSLIDPKEPLAKEYEEVKKATCISPSDENYQRFKIIQNKIIAFEEKNKSYYDGVKTVSILGDKENPAWLFSDPENSLLTNQYDDYGNQINGVFELIWNAVGQREGEYFINIKWTPIAGGETLCKSYKFNLRSASEVFTILPNRCTTDGKYETLFEKYTPESLKFPLCDGDLSHIVIKKMNESYAKVFTMLEDLSNQMADMFDSNVTQEQFLEPLAENYGLTLRSNDPTLWRRQIKEITSLRKRKGTLGAFKDALSQAGMKLVKFEQLWQTREKNTFSEYFIYDGNKMLLTYDPLFPIDSNHFNLTLYDNANNELLNINENQDEYIDILYDSYEEKYEIIWIGNEAESPIEIEQGYRIKIFYQHKIYENSTEENNDVYIRSLPLADQRDPTEQDLPKKDWNTKVIEENDPIFSSIITEFHPYCDDVVFGKVRTEFAFSENMYNADSYNGSLRDSTNQCDIDYNFIEPCSNCKTSLFNVDIEIENISDDRIIEFYSILKEWTPANSFAHTLSLHGAHSDYMPPPEELISLYMTIQGSENLLLSQGVFNRSMKDLLTREEINTMNEVKSSEAGLLKNKSINFYSPNMDFENLEKDLETASNSKLLIQDSIIGGTYIVDKTNKIYLEMNSNSVLNNMNEPIYEGSVPYKYYIEYIYKNSANINRKDIVSLIDENKEILKEDLISKKDSLNFWKIQIGTNIFDIINLSPNGVEVEDFNNLISSNFIFNLLDNNENVILSNLSGRSKRDNFSEVDLSTPGDILYNGNATNIDDLYKYRRENSYVLFDEVFYKISQFNEDNIVIKGYENGNLGGKQVSIVQMISEGVGNFLYDGIELISQNNLEIDLSIQNGENAPLGDILDDDVLKEDFLIGVGSNLYKIINIDGNKMQLEGLHSTETLSGSNVLFNVLNFQRNQIYIPKRTPINTPEGNFQNLDRNTQESISIYSNSVSSLSVDEHQTESLNTNENINLKIEWL